MQNSSSDVDDWSRALLGDGESFGRLFDRHRSRLHRHCAGLVPVPEDAADVVAIVFLEAWRRRSTVRLVGGSILPWLLVTATNIARNQTRSARRHRELLHRLPRPDYADDPADTFDDGEAIRAMNTLSLPDQQVLTLAVIEGLPERDIASVLGAPIGTVKSRLSRAKRRLAGAVAHDPGYINRTEAAHE